MGEYAIGQPMPRVEDPRLLTGRGQYGADIDLPGQAHGVVVRSPALFNGFFWISIKNYMTLRFGR